MTQIQKWPKFKNDPNSKITQNQKWPKTNNVPNSKMTQNWIKKWCNSPARRRRAGRRSVRFAFARPSSLFCVPVLFLFLYLLWVYVFYGFYVGPAKLQRGATPPSVMVLFTKVSPICLLLLIFTKLSKFFPESDEITPFPDCGRVVWRHKGAIIGPYFRQHHLLHSLTPNPPPRWIANSGNYNDVFWVWTFDQEHFSVSHD